MFSTVRPSDMQSPYELLMQNNVHFGSPDSRAGTNFKNVMVRAPLPRPPLDVGCFPCAARTAAALQVSPGSSHLGVSHPSTGKQTRPRALRAQMSVFYAVLLAFVFSRIQFPGGMRLPMRTPGRQRNGAPTSHLFQPPQDPTQGGQLQPQQRGRVATIPPTPAASLLPLPPPQTGRGGELMPPEVTFADVAGVDEAKEELMEIVVRASLPFALPRASRTQCDSVAVTLPLSHCPRHLLRKLLCRSTFLHTFSLHPPSSSHVQPSAGDPQAAGALRQARRPPAHGRAPRRRPGHRKDPPRQGCRRRGRGALLQRRGQ